MYLSPLYLDQVDSLYSGDKAASTCLAKYPYTGSPNEYHPVIFSGRKVLVLEMGPVVPDPCSSFPYEYTPDKGSDIFKAQPVTFEITTFNTEYIDRVELSYYFNSSGGSSGYGDTYATVEEADVDYSGKLFSDQYYFEKQDWNIPQTTSSEFQRWYGNADDRKSHTFTDKGSLELGKYGAQGGVTYNGHVYASNAGDGYWYSYAITATIYLKTPIVNSGTGKSISSLSCEWHASYRFYTESGHNYYSYRSNRVGLNMTKPAILYKYISLS